MNKTLPPTKLLDLSIHLSIDSGFIRLLVHVHPVLTTPENFELTITGALKAVTYLRLYRSKTRALYELIHEDKVDRPVPYLTACARGKEGGQMLGLSAGPGILWEDFFFFWAFFDIIRICMFF